MLGSVPSLIDVGVDPLENRTGWRQFGLNWSDYWSEVLAVVLNGIDTFVLQRARHVRVFEGSLQYPVGTERDGWSHQ